MGEPSTGAILDQKNIDIDDDKMYVRVLNKSTNTWSDDIYVVVKIDGTKLEGCECESLKQQKVPIIPRSSDYSYSKISEFIATTLFGALIVIAIMLGAELGKYVS